MKMKIAAPASCGPTREIALLIADARPDLCPGTDRISAVVSGATVIIRPMPKRMPPGSKSVTYETGGTNVAGLPGWKCQGALVAGMRANQSTPSAMMAGPNAMNQRGPYFAGKTPQTAQEEMRDSGPGVAARARAAAREAEG